MRTSRERSGRRERERQTGPAPAGASRRCRGEEGAAARTHAPPPPPPPLRPAGSSRDCGGDASAPRPRPGRLRELGRLTACPAAGTVVHLEGCGRYAAGAMRTEFGAEHTERGRSVHLLTAVLGALPAFLAPSRRPRGQ